MNSRDQNAAASLSRSVAFLLPCRLGNDPGPIVVEFCDGQNGAGALIFAAVGTIQPMLWTQFLLLLVSRSEAATLHTKECWSEIRSIMEGITSLEI
jgi:hypothetical protein